MTIQAFANPARYACLLTAGIVALSAPTAAADNIIFSEDWESYDTGVDGVMFEDDTLPPWAVSGKAPIISVSSGSLRFGANDGQNVLQLAGQIDTFEDGPELSVVASFPTEVGVQYELSYAYTDGRTSSSGIAFMQAAAFYSTTPGTEFLLAYEEHSSVVTPLDTTWHQSTLTFTAQSGFTSLRFSGQNLSGNWEDGAYQIDSITVTRVPAPASAGLLAAGGLVASRRRR